MWRWHVGPLPLTSKWCLRESMARQRYPGCWWVGCCIYRDFMIITSTPQINIYIYIFSLYVIKNCSFRIWLSTSEQQGIVHRIFSRKVNWYILTSFWRIRGEVHIKLCLFYNRNPGPHHKVENTPCNSCSFSSGSYLRKSFCLLHCVEEFSVSVQSR